MHVFLNSVVGVDLDCALRSARPRAHPPLWNCSGARSPATSAAPVSTAAAPAAPRARAGRSPTWSRAARMITRARYRARGATSASMSALLIRACDPHPLPSKLCLFSHPSTSVASLPRCSTAALRRAAARRRLAALNHNKPRRLHFR